MPVDTISAAEIQAKKEKKEKKRLAKLAAAANGSAGASGTATPVSDRQATGESSTKKDKKKSKKRKAEDAGIEPAENNETSLPPLSANAEQNAETAADEKKEKKDKKKDKKRKLEQLDGQTDQSGSATPVTSASATEAGSEKASKNKEKMNKKAEAQNGSAPSTSSSATAMPKPSQAEVDAFMAEHSLTYEPASVPSEYRPVLSFDALPVASGIKAGLKGFSKPTHVQSASWGVQLASTKQSRPRDIVSIAATGSGKTLAFGVPILHHLLNLPSSSKSSISALVVAPTRELAMQTQTNLGNTSEALGLGIVCIYGGAPKHEQKRLIEQKPRIVVGTPGRILDFMNEGVLDLSGVCWLVLDEADRMLDKGFENDIRTIVGACKPSSAGPDGRITSMFSATWPMSVRRLANDFMVDPVRITVGSDELSANTSVKQTVLVLTDQRQKDGQLLDVLRKEGFGKQGKTKGAQRDKVLVFALYKKEAARVHSFLERQGYEVGCIQGDLSQDKRTKALEEFRSGTTGVLVATDVAARGLDIPKVELVINYTFPLTVEDYVHRIGRTGRAGRQGKSVTFFTDNEKGLAGELQRILRDAGQEVPDALAAFGGTIKKKSHAAYGDHFKEVDMTIKPKKITFD